MSSQTTTPVASSSADTTTLNGALTHSSSSDPLVDFYFGAVKDTPQDRLAALVDAAATHDLLATLRLIFDARNCRGGKGRRDVFLGAGQHLMSRGDINADQAWMHNLKHVPTFGYFKDLWVYLERQEKVARVARVEVAEAELTSTTAAPVDVCSTPATLSSSILTIYADQLSHDCQAVFGMPPSQFSLAVKTGTRPSPIQNKVAISLAAKFAPRVKTHFVKYMHGLIKQLQMSEKAYRWLVVDLCKHLNVVETQMSIGNWTSIDYSKIPSVATSRYIKAFKKHDPEGWKTFKTRVREGKTKINVAQLSFPDTIQKIRYSPKPDDDLELLVSEYVRKMGTSMSEVVVVADTSGSMGGVYIPIGASGSIEPRPVAPIDVCLALTLLAASNIQGELRDHYIAFSERSELIKIKGETWHEKIKITQNGPWGGSTNVQAAFDRVLEAMKAGTSVKVIIIVSDMQFDSCGGKKTNFERIQKRFDEAGLRRPTLVFWNVSAACTDVPVKSDQHGTILVSGFTPSLFEMLVDQPDNVTPRVFIDQIVAKPCYQVIQLPSSE